MIPLSLPTVSSVQPSSSSNKQIPKHLFNLEGRMKMIEPINISKNNIFIGLYVNTNNIYFSLMDVAFLFSNQHVAI